MGRITKIVLGALGAAVVLGLAHASLNLGFDPLRALGLKKEMAEEARFRVGFLPVT